MESSDEVTVNSDSALPSQAPEVGLESGAALGERPWGRAAIWLAIAAIVLVPVSWAMVIGAVIPTDEHYWAGASFALSMTTLLVGVLSLGSAIVARSHREPRSGCALGCALVVALPWLLLVFLWIVMLNVPI